MFWKRRRKNKKEVYEDFFKEIEEKRGTSAEEERRKILAVITYLTDGILVFDRNGRLSLINPQAEHFLNVKQYQVLGKAILDLSVFPNFKPVITILGGGIQEISRKELQIKENFILEVSSIPMLIQEEKIGSMVVLHDVSREKLVEKAKSEFVMLAAHQLRTPTSAVKWSLKTLLDGDLGAIPEKQKRIIKESYKTNERVIYLIQDLLNIAKIEEGKYISKTTLSNMEDVILSVLEAYKETVKRKKLKIKLIKKAEKLPRVMLDVDKIRIAVDNVIDNAIRYTLPKGKIDISIGADNEKIEIQVKDNGIGIPRYQHDSVFTKFFRGRNALRLETEGTGLGLYISKYIIEAHGGSIWFESEEGKGTTFYFTIPVKERFGEFLTGDFY